MENTPSPPPAAVREDLLESGRVRGLVDRLYKAVRATLLYPSTSPLPGDFQRALHESLAEYLAHHPSLELHVRDNELLHDGKSVHKDIGGEIDLTGPLGRDGIESLTFLPGVTLDELGQFLAVIKRAVKERNPDEDLVTMLWEAAPRRIRYKVVEGLAEDVGARPVRPAAKTTKAAGTAAEAGAGAAGTRGAGFGTGGGAAGAGAGGGGAQSAAADEQAASAAATKTSGIARILNQLSDFTGDIAQRDAYRLEAARFDPVASTIGIVLEILAGEESIEGFQETCGLIDDLYDRLLEQADFGPALRIHEGLAQAEREEADAQSPRARRLRDSRLRAADSIRVGNICAALNAFACRNLDGARRLLTLLPEELVPHLAGLLGDLEHIPARRMACDILAARGAAHVDAIGALVLDPRWFVVRNAVQVLSRIGGPRAAAHLEKAASHANPIVRRVVLDAVSRVETEDANVVLRSALSDPSRDLALRALRALAERRDAGASGLVERRIVEADFLRLKSEEQQEWLSALARIQGDSALPLFRRLIARRFWEGKARRYLRLTAIAALGAGGGPGTTAFLEELARDRDETVRGDAQLALDRSRKARGS